LAHTEEVEQLVPLKYVLNPVLPATFTAPPAPPAPAPQQSGAVEKKPSNDAKPSKPQDTKRQAPKKKAPEKSDEKQNGGHNDTP
jgi:hypothetical protein